MGSKSLIKVVDYTCNDGTWYSNTRGISLTDFSVLFGSRVISIILYVQNVHTVPDVIGTFANLETFCITEVASDSVRLQYLPHSIGQLVKLQYLNITSFQQIRLPASVRCLRNVQDVTMRTANQDRKWYRSLNAAQRYLMECSELVAKGPRVVMKTVMLFRMRAGTVWSWLPKDVARLICLWVWWSSAEAIWLDYKGDSNTDRAPELLPLIVKLPNPFGVWPMPLNGIKDRLRKTRRIDYREEFERSEA